MSFEPQKFFIGVVEFFAVLMPGGLLAYLGKDRAAGVLFHRASWPLDSAEAWMVFLFTSYLLGHFAFLFGATLDNWVYDPLRKCTYWGFIDRLAKGKDLQPWHWRKLATCLFGKEPDHAVMLAQRIKTRALLQVSDEAPSAVNAFQWCKATLSKGNPDGLVAVQRFEADSKFFRSFAVLLALLAVILAVQGDWTAAAISAGLLLAALWRYLDQRFKATQQAYREAITLEAAKEAKPVTASAINELTHAGGVVFWASDTGLKYLLLEAEKDRTRWVLPKGHIEPGETPRQTAVREVQEETGQWARVIKWVTNERLGKDVNSPLVRFWLMQTVGNVKDPQAWPAENRRHDWFSLGHAVEKASFPETKALLGKADEVRVKASAV